MKNMIVVTGGAGFIGSNIILALNNIGYTNILVVDNLKNCAKFTNLVDLNISDYIDKSDFIKKLIFNTNFFNISTIFHQGACSVTTKCNGKYMMKNNYQYSKELVLFSIRNKIPFIYASSASVYGNKNSNFSERKEYENPLNIYSYSKFLFDQFIRSILPKAKTQICGLRYFNVYGPNENHKGSMASMIFRLNKQVISNKTPKIFQGSENFKRDFIYVKDVAMVNVWMWKKNISGIFNCGSGKTSSFKDIANIVLRYHKKHDIDYINIPKNIKKYYQTYTKANLVKLRNVGYLKDFKNVEDGIAEYLDFLNYKL